MRLPYPGLRPFQREESDLFFGREGCVDDMVDRLAATRFLAVLGASGSGKSSLVVTGLLDALEIGLHVRAGSRWRIAHLRPGNRPAENLARVLLCSADEQRLPSDLDIELLSSYLRRGPRSVAEWCLDGNLPSGTNLLILVDQFEELFRYSNYAGREEAEAFVALLLESARAVDTAIHVTITMRSEYLGACALIPGLAERINAGLYLAPRMTREEVREAIEGPAGVCGLSIEPALLNRLLNDLSSLAPWEDDRSGDQLQRLSRRADQLPLMQHVLNRMWLRAAEAAGIKPIRLLLADYDRLGGLTGALDAHAREVFDGLDEADRPVVETVFRALISGTSLANAVRRPCRFDELVATTEGRRAAVIRVVDAFRAPNCNFLTPSAQIPLDDATIVDVSHESLIRQWSSLSEWLDKEVRAAALWRRLVAATESYNDAEGSLLGGLDLANFSAWWEREPPNATWAMRHGGSFKEVRGFLEKSQAAENDRLTREQARDRRERRRLQYGLAIGIVLTVIASAFGIIAQRSQIRLAQANIDLHQAVENRDKSLVEAQSVLNSVTRILGSDEHFTRIGSEKLQKDLLAELQPHFAQLAAMASADAGLSQDEIEARFLLGRLTSRVQSREAALPILQPLFEHLEARYSGRAISDEDALDFAKVGDALATTYRVLGQPERAGDITKRLAQHIPQSDVDLTTLSVPMLDAYFWYLDCLRQSLPWSAESRWRRAVHQREVQVADRLVVLAGERAWSHFTRQFAYSSWKDTLYTEGRFDEAERALDIATQEAKATYDRAPQNSTFLTAYAGTLRVRAHFLLQKGALEDAQQTAQRAADLIKPALTISPDSALLLDQASAIFDELGNILQYRKDLNGALARKLDAVEAVIHELETDPLNRSVADNALTHFSNLRWILTDVHDNALKGDRCLALGRRTLALALAHPDINQHVQLMGATIACALDAEQALAVGNKIPANDRPTDELILANADFLLQAFRDLKLEPDDIGQSYEQIAEIIEHVQQIAGEKGDLTTAENIASRIIAVLDHLRPQLDYDYYTINKISVAHLAIGDYRRRVGDVTEAARHYRICSDPEQVAYPSVGCMGHLIEMINAGNLGNVNQDEVNTLRDRMSLYRRKSFTLIDGITINGGAVKIPVSYNVSTPPKGYRGIDAQATWLKRVTGLELPQDIIDWWRRVDGIARARHVPLIEVAVYNLGVDADKATGAEIINELGNGNASGALDQAEKLYRKIDGGDADRRIGVIAALSDGLQARAKEENPTDPKAFATALERIRRLVAADDDAPATTEIRWAFTELLLDVGDAQPDTQKSRARDLSAEAVEICRRWADGKPADPRWRIELARSLFYLAIFEETTDGARAALPHITESANIFRDSYVVSGNAVDEGKLYSSGLGKLMSIAGDAREDNTAVSAGQERIGVLRTLTVSDEKLKPELTQTLGLLSWYSLLTRQWPEAKAAADEALALDPKQIWIETNAAHARMFGGDTEAARERYLANRGKKIENHGTWEEVILDDFKQLREAGLDHPLMDEIEKQFASAAVPAQ
jgi:tetratricopeptide (TPR) repeat protein